jgi:hypothetical protein
LQGETCRPRCGSITLQSEPLAPIFGISIRGAADGLCLNQGAGTKKTQSSELGQGLARDEKTEVLPRNQIVVDAGSALLRSF